MAFTCLEQERLVGSTLAAELRAAVHGAKKRMVEAQGEDGFFGNVYSTPWAMQVGVQCGGTPASDMGLGLGCRRGCEHRHGVNIVRFNKAKCNVMPLSQGNPQHKDKWSGNGMEQP